MIATFEFYKNEFKGLAIETETDYNYFGERASDELAPFLDLIPNGENSQNALRRCACRIADILKDQSKQGKVSSESVGGYYSVSYNSITNEQVRKQINTAINLYLGRFIKQKIVVRY